MIVLTVTVLSFTLTAFADVGNFNDYGSDFSGGWSSSDWDSGYSGGDFIFIGTGGMSVGSVVVIVIIIIIFAIIKSKVKTAPRRTVRQRPSITVPIDRSNETEAKIQAHDADFSAEKMLSYAGEVFVKLQNAWTRRDWEQIRTFESESLFNLHEAMLKEYTEKGRINVIERISLGKSFITNYQCDSETERVNIYLEAQMIDYIIDEKTGDLLNGSKTERYLLRYDLEFIRTAGTLSGNENITTNCPNCGATTTVTSAGKCEYCDSVIVNSSHGWVLNKLTGIK